MLFVWVCVLCEILTYIILYQRYEGEWRAGKRHGHGCWSNAAGERYEGQWVSGVRLGFGVLHSAKASESVVRTCVLCVDVCRGVCLCLLGWAGCWSKLC